ncbi:flagellar FliJ protein [Proteiniborus ethanoligenes]|uniref:Flagellar FliJ protein n=1 Tax=Proteiniborus ethanoligenes TaxID=415015 RepID=A0A1H3PNE4_9FIRM|nr:flagellar export protein FliJ [Proteiniborus ethanoligenes]SDZ02782.1 flagellar FliJ protein [Proteiniborus ethanoligenes]
MEKFNFRLNKVLEYRESIENINKSEYGKAKKKLDDETEILEEIISYKDSINLERDKLASKTTIRNFKNYDLYLKSIKEKLIEQSNIVEAAQTNAEVARNKLINSSVDKKILENLRKRDFDNYLYQVKKQEEKIIDQIVSYKSSVK